MSVTLESVSTAVPEEPIEELEETAPEEPQETIPEEPPAAPPPPPPEEPVVIKKRGRPPKAKAEAKPKAAPKARIKKPVTPVESSSEEDTPINRDDMDTMLLQYLLQRKHAQRDSRRAMWVQMAGLS